MDNFLDYYEEQLNDAIKDIDIQIKASELRKDEKMTTYLQGNRQGLALALELLG